MKIRKLILLSTLLLGLLVVNSEANAYGWLKPRHAPNKCADNPGWSLAKGKYVDIWQCVYQANEYWDIAYKGAGLYTIKNMYSKQCMTAGGDKRVYQYPCGQYTSGYWHRLPSSKPGYYRYSNHWFGACLTVERGSKANGARLIVAPCTTYKLYQQWGR